MSHLKTHMAEVGVISGGDTFRLTAGGLYSITASIGHGPPKSTFDRLTCKNVQVYCNSRAANLT
ncbi:hypothetical protein F2P79_014431 [Pimephales promelas]|nr:hypothetical protein F2P79_014431 [Pimephales promelas]